MLTDSERFAFTARRLHALPTTGNAYDACQTDEGIATGDTLVVLAEGVVGIAWTWPLAVTASAGNLHSAKHDPDATVDQLATDFGMQTEDIAFAVAMARALHLPLDAMFEHVCPAT